MNPDECQFGSYGFRRNSYGWRSPVVHPQEPPLQIHNSRSTYENTHRDQGPYFHEQTMQTTSMIQLKNIGGYQPLITSSHPRSIYQYSDIKVGKRMSTRPDSNDFSIETIKSIVAIFIFIFLIISFFLACRFIFQSFREDEKTTEYPILDNIK